MHLLVLVVFHVVRRCTIMIVRIRICSVLCIAALWHYIAVLHFASLGLLFASLCFWVFAVLVLNVARAAN